MTEAFGIRVLEELSLIRKDAARMLNELALFRIELAAFPGQVRHTELQQDVHHEDIASLKVRLDRIEKRLELVD